MKTNFFQSIRSLNIKGDWNITIKSEEQEKVIVSVLLSLPDVNDEAAKSVPPMLFKGTPQELDEGFFQALSKPAKDVSSLFLNMQQFADELEKAKENSRMEAEKEKKQKTEKDEKKKKYDTQMKKVEELEEKEKWGEAIGAMPKADQYPDQADEIKMKMDELRKKHGSLELFT